MSARLKTHPILGTYEKGEPVTFTYDGKPNVRTCMTPLAAGMDVRTQYGVSDVPFDDILKETEADA